MFYKIKIFVFVLLATNILCSLFTFDVFAHTASITTDDTVVINAAAVGDHAGISADNLDITSTCPLGYTVSIKGPSDNKLYKDGDNTETSYISPSAGTTANPASILGNNLGTWGYTTSYNATTSSNFIGLTSTEAQITSKASASASGGDELTVYYGASVTDSLLAGGYSLAESSQGADDNKIIYYLTPNANCANYVIRYNDNGANSTTTMGITHNVIEDDEVTLAASNYKRAGYGFAGWSTVQLNPNSSTFQTDLATAVAAGNVFGPNETITADASLLAQATAQNNTQYITLYAVWVKPATNTTYLQNWHGCDSLSTGSVIALIDQRDSQTYAVSKLADGNCWMIENLRLEAANSSDATKAQGYGGVFAGLATAETSNFSNSTTANSKYYSGTQSGTATINIGTTDSPGYRFPRYNNSNTNSTVSNMTAANANVYSYGNYYNWPAAKANTSKLDNENNSSNANTSLCPAGWKLPTGKGDGDYGKLSNSLGGYKNAYNVAQPMSSSTTPTGAAMSNIFRSFPNNYVYAALIDVDTGNPEFERGAYGQYLTATARNSSDVYHFVINNTNTNPGTWNLGKKYDAGSVRCMASTGYTITFNANGGSGTMENQTLFANESAKLSANTFSAPAMGQSYQNANNTTISATAGKVWTFWGWNTNANGSGNWYKDKEAVSNLASSGSTITLYAQWKQATLADMATPTSGTKTITHTTMQDMSGAVCYNSDITTKAELQAANKTGATTLTDNRDGTVRSYDVSKLADGSCWMTTNLALGTDSSVILTSEDTDLEEGTTFTLPAGDTTSYTSTTREPRIRLTNNSGTSDNGVYYTWSAAVADTTSRSDSPTTSICPKNWDLPTREQYSTLISASSWNSSSNLTYDLPSQFKNDGGFTNGSTFYVTTSGRYWTSTSSSSTLAYNASVGSSSITLRANSGTAAGGNKYYRQNIRCRTNMDEVSYKITFVNTSDGSIQTKGIVWGDSGTVQPPDDWSRANYSLIGWDTNNAGTNVVYAKGQNITLSSDITVYTVWKPVYTITYNGNGADAGAMTNVKHTNVFESDVFDLFASNYSRANYGFAGWSFDANAQPGGASRIYGPNETITAPAPTNPGQAETKTLYAVWVPAQTGVYMQTWNGCGSLASGAVIALKDQRDNNVYTVGKLADGNCWMMENLRLDNSATGNTDGSLAQGYGTGFIGLADPETANFSNSTTANTLYSTTNITGSNQGYRFPRYNNVNTTSRSTNPSRTDDRSTATSAHTYDLSDNIYSYGNYYTWAAAIADINNRSVVDVDTSICPTGWRLPYSDSATSGAIFGGFYNLTVQLGGNASSHSNFKPLRDYPNNFVYSGARRTSSYYLLGEEGSYWTSGASSYTSSGIMTINNNTANMLASNTYKYVGRSVRCVKLDDPSLYNKVASQSKGPQTASELQTAITSSNSGVYEYDDTEFGGAASDASNDYTVYYYRGILDETTGTYGSDGDGVAYPNYVILDEDGTKTTADTCWRIVRTTGSGGVKMIYNGNWTGSTCANAQTAATTKPGANGVAFNGTTSTRNQAIRIGYTYNDSYADNTNTSRTLATLFGSDSSYSGNTTSSDVKTEVETWFTNNIDSYTNLLEPSAGYCNDRSAYNTSGTLQNETSVTTQQYETTGVTRLNFGAYNRNSSTNQNPTLGCPRSTVDLYSTASASGGNKQLSKPVALLTADEASFAGSGNQTASNGSYYNANSFLNIGSNFLLLSPSYRNTNGRVYVLRVSLYGYQNSGYVSGETSVRPVISLNAGVIPASGTGIATDPWVITAP